MSAPRRALDPSVPLDDSTSTVPQHGAPETDEDFAPEPHQRPGRRRVIGVAALLACGATALGVSLRSPAEQPVSVPSPTAFATVDANAVSRSAPRGIIAGLTLDPTSATPAAKATPAAAPSTTAKPGASPRPSVAAKPSTTPSASPSVDATSVGRPAAPRWATTVVNLRSGPSATSDKLATLPAGTKVISTDRVVGDWRQVTAAGRVGWILGENLAWEAPATSGAGASTAPAASAPSRGKAATGGSCASTAVENGLASNAVAVHRAVCANFPNITSFGGVRASNDEHGTGHALDCMVTGEAGWELARWARAHASELGITEVIYSQQIWTTQRAGDGWRSMSDRGGVTANHYDHVHITVS